MSFVSGNLIWKLWCISGYWVFEDILFTSDDVIQLSHSFLFLVSKRGAVWAMCDPLPPRSTDLFKFNLKDENIHE
jgi:hypothetical protein